MSVWRARPCVCLLLSFLSSSALPCAVRWQYRLIYSGSKFFWRTSATVDVNMYLYEAQGADSLVLILPYDPTADKVRRTLAQTFQRVDV